MALYETFMVPCVLCTRSRVPDGEGGWTTTWTDGPSFDAAIVLEGSANPKVAEAQGVASSYIVTVDRSVVLNFHDAFKREGDGVTFRVTKANDPTPRVATFQFNQYHAEEWELA